MGEYAKRNGKEIKIGTCESMYYLRYEHRKQVQPMPGNVNPAPDVPVTNRSRSIAGNHKIDLNIYHIDGARTILDLHSSSNVGHIDFPGTILDFHVSLDIAYPNLTGAVIDGYVAPDRVHLDGAGAIIDRKV